MSNITKNFQNKARRGLGMVHGRRSTGDNIPVKVSADEAILPKKTVRALGGAKGVAHLIKKTTGKAPTGIRAGSHHVLGGVDEVAARQAKAMEAGQLINTRAANAAANFDAKQGMPAVEARQTIAAQQAQRTGESTAKIAANFKPAAPPVIDQFGIPAGRTIPASPVAATIPYSKTAIPPAAPAAPAPAGLQLAPKDALPYSRTPVAAPTPQAPTDMGLVPRERQGIKTMQELPTKQRVGMFEAPANVLQRSGAPVAPPVAPPVAAPVVPPTTTAPAPMIGDLVAETPKPAAPVRAGVRGLLDKGMQMASDAGTAVKNKIPGMGTAVAETVEAAAPKPNAIGRLNSMANEAVDLSKVGSQVTGAVKTGATIPGMVAEGFSKLHGRIGPLMAPIAAVTDIAGDQSATGIAQGAFDIATGLGSKAGGWLTAPADIATRITNNGRGLVQTMKDRFTGDYVPESAAKGTDQLLSLLGVNGPDTLAAKGGQLYKRGMEQQASQPAPAPTQAGPQVVGLPKPAETYPMSTPGSQQPAGGAPARPALDPNKMLDQTSYGNQYAVPSGTGSIRSSNGKAMLIDSRPSPEQQAAAAKAQAGPDMSTSAGVLQQAQALLTSRNADQRVVGAKLMRHAYPQMVAAESSRYGHDKSFESARLTAEAQRGVMGLEQSRKEDENARQAKDAYRKGLEGQFMKSGKDGKQEVDQTALGEFMRLAESTAAKRLSEAKTPEEAARWQNRVNGKSRSVAELDDADKSELLKNFRMRARHAEGAGSWYWDNDRADSDDLHDWTPTESNGRLEFPRLSARRSDGKKVGGQTKNYAYTDGPIGYWDTQMGKTPTNEFLPTGNK